MGKLLAVFRLKPPHLDGLPFQEPARLPKNLGDVLRSLKLARVHADQTGATSVTPGSIMPQHVLLLFLAVFPELLAGSGGSPLELNPEKSLPSRFLLHDGFHHGEILLLSMLDTSIPFLPQHGSLLAELVLAILGGDFPQNLVHDGIGANVDAVDVSHKERPPSLLTRYNYTGSFQIRHLGDLHL